MGLNVAIIGGIPEGLPKLQLNNLMDVDYMQPMLIIIPALTLAALGTIDSLLTDVTHPNDISIKIVGYENT